MPLPTRLQFYMPARVKYDSIRHELSVDILHLIVTPLTNSNPANMSTSSCTRMPRHTPFSRSISHSPSCLCFVPTSMFPLQLSSPHERRHRKLNHRTFHVVPSVTILMTAVRTDRTLKEEGADGKMTDKFNHKSAHRPAGPHQTTYHIEHLTTVSLHVAHIAWVAFTNGFLERTATTGFRHFRHTV